MFLMRKRTTVAALVISGSAMIGIALHEEYRGNAYNDGVGVQTIGFGTTQGVKKGDKITVERALVKLGQNIGEKEAAMRACMGPVPLYQNEWDAYVSLSYNIGTGAFCKSTLVKKLKQTPPDYSGACKEILKWNRGGGRVLPGLVVRRNDEYKECMKENL
jgi:lysozyme